MSESHGSSDVAAAAARLNEAWGLLEASEAARRRLQDEVKVGHARSTSYSLVIVRVVYAAIVES